jgi:hypothetical protein
MNQYHQSLCRALGRHTLRGAEVIDRRLVCRSCGVPLDNCPRCGTRMWYSPNRQRYEFQCTCHGERARVFTPEDVR